MPEPNFSNRTLYHGDNLDFLRGMNSETVDLIATDPPFNKSRDFHATPDSLAAGSSFEDRWSWRDDIHDSWLIQIQRDSPEVWHIINAAKNVYGDDMGAFICWLGVRLLEMRRVLKPTGSIYLHCDDTASHYIKSLMDAIFGHTNFRNHLTWRRATAHNDAKRYGNVTDTLLYYAMSRDSIWNGEAIFTAKTEEGLKEAFPMRDSHGQFRSENLTGPSHGASSGSPSTLPWHGYDVLAMGRVWSVPKTGAYAEYIERHFIPGYRSIEDVHARLDALDTAGLINHPKGRGRWPGLKRYAAADRGNPPMNLILDPTGFTNYNKGRGEYVGYPTQKPLALYERIIRASSNPGDIVLDPFCGCATTPIAAERLGRQWVGMDIWDKAYQMVLDRLESEGLAVPYEDDERRNSHLLTFGDVNYTATPPVRTDSGEEAVLYLQTPRARERRYPPPRSQQENLLNDIGAFCQGCGRYYGFDTRVLEVDHIRPKSDGGSDAYDNLTLLCPPCNREKRDRMTLTGLQDYNRRNGHLAPENEENIRHGRARAARRRRR